jgi:hypothetical protein
MFCEKSIMFGVIRIRVARRVAVTKPVAITGRVVVRKEDK